MKERVKNALAHDIEVAGKAVPTLFIALALIGGGSAAVMTVVSPTITGSGQVTNGFQYKTTGVSGSATHDGDHSYTISTAQGGQFGFALAKENLANDATEPLVETMVLDADGTSLNYKTLEQFSFEAEQTTPEDQGSTVPAGTTVFFQKNISATGQVTSTDDRYMEVANADTDGDSEDEILVCVGDSNGMKFGPSEHWDANWNFDTQSGFPETTVNADAEMHLMHDPTTGSHPDIVGMCPQYSSP